MDFSLSDEQTEFVNSVRTFAEKALQEDVRARDKAGTFDRQGWERCAEFGIQGLVVPEAYGGMDADIVKVLLCMQVLGQCCPDAGLLFTLCSHMLTCELPLALFGSDDQKSTYLPAMARGELIGCHAMTEPGAGSDAYSLKATATKDGDHYVLNGTKTFISNAPIADVFLVFASTNLKRGFAGVTGFIVEKGDAGLSVSKPFDKLGLKTSPTGEVVLEDCRIPASRRLGKEGQGSAIFNAEMEWERSCLFATHLGAMQRQLDTCIAYCRERKQFGQPIGKFQAVAHKIADMRVRIELGELILHKVAWLKKNKKRAQLESAIAKLVVSEAYVQSSLDGIQIHGGYGFMSEYEAERHLRDSIGGRLYSGTSEIQKNIISQLLGL